MAVYFTIKSDCAIMKKIMHQNMIHKETYGGIYEK